MVVDASVVIAWIKNEAGAERLEQELVQGSVGLSTVNLAEVLSFVAKGGQNPQEVEELLRDIHVQFIPFTAKLARKAAELRPLTQDLGLSLGDRACLATGLITDQQHTVLTADRAWAGLNLQGLEIILIR